jgi:uncharacterized protein with FMN-binding domain/succinate dehydrogenase/fumarate reductase flavoprotein subunit
MKKLIALLLCISMALSFAACAAPAEQQEPAVTEAPTPAPETEEPLYTDGTYTGSANGMGGAVPVTVTVSGGKITEIVVGDNKETPGVSDPAIEQIPAAIIEAQSAEVDVVAGATVTSKAIMEAVANALSGKGGEEQSASVDITIEPDVIVVGAGMAGLVSAVKACELGANVLVLEQSGRVGGSANFAGGSISGAGFKIQKEFGVDDSPEQFYADFVRLSGGEDFNTEIAKVHTERSGAAIDWLTDVIGVDFGAEHRLDTGSYEPMYPDRVTYALAMSPAGGAQGFLQALTPKLEECIAEGKAQLLLNTLVTDVIVEEGNIAGVMIGDKEVRADSTIIATGGYGYSEDWLLEYNFDQVASANPPTAIGSGYNFARKVGAVFDKMDFCACYAGCVPVSGFQASISCNTGYPGAIIVNNAGERILNEKTADTKAKSDAYKAAESNTVYVIVSEKMFTDEKNLFNPAIGAAPFDSKAKLEELLAEGKYVFKADTIEELAALIGTAKLAETVEKYNADCAAGKDSVFGRTDELVPFEEGPFYAVYTIPYVLMTSGGPRINGQAQLVREDGSVVGGAYLAGEIIGSANIAGKTTIGGIGHGMCTTWGIIAAENAVSNAKIK